MVVSFFVVEDLGCFYDLTSENEPYVELFITNSELVGGGVKSSLRCFWKWSRSRGFQVV